MSNTNTLKTYNCGCFGGPFQFCPTHAAAPEMYAFLQDLAQLWTLQAGTKASFDPDRERERVRALLREIETDSGGRQMQTDEQTRKQPPKPLTLGETERLRLPLKGGRTVRLLFTGSLPTQTDIDKLIALLELSKDSFPKSDEQAED